MTQPNQIHPAFPNSFSAIVFAADDFFCPYLAVMLFSVLAHTEAENRYDIIILYRDISAERRTRLAEMTQGKPNVSLRFCDVSARIAGYAFYTGGKENFSIDAYLRLLIPSVLSGEYRSALYLDGDMLALTDIAPLLQTDLTGYLLASTRDMGGIADYYQLGWLRKDYRDRVLRLDHPNDYFISGLLLFNLPAFRAEFTQEELLELAASRKWLQHDQDVLNVLCRGGRAKLLHARWDVMKPYKPECLPPALRQELEESLADPGILHFGGDEKPWKNTLSPWMDVFWETAVQTPFYKEIIYRILQEHPGTINEVMVRRFEQGEIGFRYVIKFFRAWLNCKRKHRRDGEK